MVSRGVFPSTCPTSSVFRRRPCGTLSLSRGRGPGSVDSVFHRGKSKKFVLLKYDSIGKEYMYVQDFLRSVDGSRSGLNFSFNEDLCF